jgi:hypothetical protein
MRIFFVSSFVFCFLCFFVGSSLVGHSFNFFNRLVTIYFPFIFNFTFYFLFSFYLSSVFVFLSYVLHMFFIYFFQCLGLCCFFDTFYSFLTSCLLSIFIYSLYVCCRFLFCSPFIYLLWTTCELSTSIFGLLFVCFMFLYDFLFSHDNFPSGHANFFFIKSVFLSHKHKLKFHFLLK